MKMLAKLSWFVPRRIVVCAQSAIKTHVAVGYSQVKMHFIPNGYDLTEFQPMQLAPDQEFILTHKEPGLPLIGCVGRLDPQKDHLNLFKALAILRKKHIRFICILVGGGLEESNLAFVELINKFELFDCVRLIGQRNDIPLIMNSLDLHILPSSAEAFPNVVCEAMACGTPCIVTDVGDASYIVGDTGWIVPAQDSSALACAIEEALIEIQGSKWGERCLCARESIKTYFSIDHMIDCYNEVWGEVMQ